MLTCWLSCFRQELTKVVYFVKADGKLVVSSDFILGKKPPSLKKLSMGFKAADGSTYSLASTDKFQLMTELGSLSTENQLREAEAFEVTMKQRISKDSFSAFEPKLLIEVRKMNGETSEPFH